ncbi:MAG: amidohydrolase family protein [Nitrospinae bacterium]|nr:amidohydrolase family protein [Nitrospinota bacterium]
MKKLILNGGWLLPVSSPPIKGGTVIIEGGTIVYVGKSKDEPCEADSLLGGENIVLIPGLVNAHTHLELTAMEGKVGKGLSFKEWVEAVISYRGGMSKEAVDNSIRQGVEILISNGTTTVGDFTSTGRSASILAKLGLRGVAFNEIVSFREDASQAAFKGVKDRIENGKKTTGIIQGIAPHSPYSVSASLLRDCHNYAEKMDIPISIHIAETGEEKVFIDTGKGPLRDLLNSLGKWEESWQVPGMSPVQYLSRLGALDGTIGVHLNLIDDADIEILKERGVSVVYCPGSNRWFGREKVCPVERLLAEGINVALGTDGLSSNSNLSILEEMRLLKKEFASIADEEILKMGTLNGAKALRFGDIGAIETGFRGDLVGIRLENQGGGPYNFLSDTKFQVEFVIIGGKIVYKKH